MIRGTKWSQEQAPTLVDDRALRSTVTVCSWAETSSIVRGRLAREVLSDQRGKGKDIHYFSTQGCNAGTGGCLDSTAALLCWG